MKNLLQTKIEIPSFIPAAGRTFTAGLVHFFKRPFSIWAAAVIAFVFGAFGPIQLRILDRARFGSWEYDFESVPWYPLIFTSAVLAWLHWMSVRIQFRWHPRTVIGTILAALLMVASWAMSYFGCAQEHLCMTGHLHHPPYATQTYLFDAAWALGLIVATVTLCRCRCPLAIVTATMTGFMIVFRFVFGSFGGIYIWF